MAPPHISICPAERGDSYLRSLENTSGVQIVFYSQIVDIVSSYLQCDAIILTSFCGEVVSALTWHQEIKTAFYTKYVTDL